MDVFFLHQNSDKGYVIVKAVLSDEKEIVFKLTLNDNERIAKTLSAHFASSGQAITVDGNVGTVLVSNSNLSGSISLPEIDGCEILEFGDEEFSDAIFKIKPRIEKVSIYNFRPNSPKHHKSPLTKKFHKEIWWTRKIQLCLLISILRFY